MKITIPLWIRGLCVAFMVASQAFAQVPDTVIESKSPMELETPGTGTHGQLAVAPEVVAGSASGDLIYTITEGAQNGRG